MHDLWGISSGQFTFGFFALLIAPTIAGPLWRRWRIRRMKPDGPPAPGLTAHHLAYLSASPLATGGALRAVESAVAALVHAGRVRVAAKGRLFRIAKGAPENSFERAVFAHARNGAQIPDIPIKVRPALAKLSDDLAERGLALRESTVVAYRTAIIVFYVVLETVGIVRGMADIVVRTLAESQVYHERRGGHHNGRAPQFEGFLDIFPLLILGVVLMAIWGYLRMNGKRDYLTQAGRNFVLEAIASWRAGTPGPGGLMIEGTAVVAIAGIVGYPDKEIASVLVGRRVVD